MGGLVYNVYDRFIINKHRVYFIAHVKLELFCANSKLETSGGCSCFLAYISILPNFSQGGLRVLVHLIKIVRALEKVAYCSN